MDYVEIYNKEHIQNRLSYSEIRKKYDIPRGTWDYYVRYKAKLSADNRIYVANDSFYLSRKKILADKIIEFYSRNTELT